MGFDAIRAEVLRISDLVGIPPAKITRATFRQHSELGQTQAERKHWQHVRRSWLAPLDAPAPLIPEGHHLTGVSTLVDEHGEIKIQWLKTAAGKMSREALIAKLIEGIKVDPLPPAPAPVAAPGGEEFLAVYPLGDLHLGMYAAALETGQDWDLARGVQIARQAIDDLALYGEPADLALLINLGDFFHTSGPAGTTVKGTPQDTSGTYLECMEAGLSLKIYMIRRLLQTHKRVIVWGRIGNHDGVAAVMLMIALREHFRNDDRVEIKVNPSAVDCLRFGKVQIASTHGDSRGAKSAKDFLALIAHDHSEEWSGALHRYGYLGHVHHKVQKEETGGVCEWFRTTTAPDGWHSGAMYRAGRDMVRILIHEEDGEVSRKISSVGRLRRIYGTP